MVIILKFVLATANPGKIQEMREILFELGIEFVTREELGINIIVEETGSTFIENALLKAKAICEASDLPAVADDSGLMVNALNGEPGVYSSTFGGAELDCEERCAYLLERLRGVEQRGAKFVSTIVCAFPDGLVMSAVGECNGKITTIPRGINGFGYDPVFIADGETRTMAELSPQEKNKASHRGKALREFADMLQAYYRERGIR